MPLLETVGRGLEAEPEHTTLFSEKEGMTSLFTTTVMLTGTAHDPAFGVNVYVVVCRSFTAGDQVPLTPLVEVGGRVMFCPAQTGPKGVNTGTTKVSMTIVIVVPVPHWLDNGVKVYVVVWVLFMAGDHVPWIPFWELGGKGARVVCSQTGPTAANSGIVLLSII